MLTKEQLDELKEMLSNGDHPTKQHRADLIALIAGARQPEQIEAVIAEVRHRDQATPWRAACDEIMDRLRRLFDET